VLSVGFYSKQAVRVATKYATAHCKLTIYSLLFARWRCCSGILAIYDISNKLTFDLLTLKVVSESRVTWATSVSILVFLGLSIIEPDVRYRQTDVRRQT